MVRGTVTLLSLALLTSFVSVSFAETKVNHQGVWKTPQSTHAKHSGTWKPVVQVYQKESGVWRVVFSGTAPSGNQITAVWEYPDTTDITQFNLYMNGEILCSTSTGTDLTVTCQTVEALALPASFYATAVHSTLGESSPSNTIVYNGP